MAFTLQIGEPCPDFSLPAVDGKTYARDDFADAEVIVVAFTCNHCPYVIGSEERIITYAADYKQRGVALVAINSNETENHPGDSFENMQQRARERGFNFPYLRDDSQEVARAFGALKTPHFFVFDKDRKLRYTGRMDDSPREARGATTRELRDATEAILRGEEPKVPLTNPIGCNIKWQGKPEKWMPAEACDLV
jgi:peroxiredoxin